MSEKFYKADQKKEISGKGVSSPESKLERYVEFRKKREERIAQRAASKSVEPESYTMKEVVSRLSVKKDALVYLCTMNVVVPDIEDPPKGRGHVRRFSEFNIFEFAVALELKDYNIKIGYISIIMRMFRKLFQELEFMQDGLGWLRFKLDKNLPQLIMVIMDAESMYFRIRNNKGDKLVQGINLTKLRESFDVGALDDMGRAMTSNLFWWKHDDIWTEDKSVKIPMDAIFDPNKQDIEKYRSKLEVNLNRIAWEI